MFLTILKQKLVKLFKIPYVVIVEIIPHGVDAMKTGEKKYGFRMFYDGDGSHPNRTELIRMIELMYGVGNIRHTANALKVDPKFLIKWLSHYQTGCPEIVRDAIQRDWNWHTTGNAPKKQAENAKLPELGTVF